MCQLMGLMGTFLFGIQTSRHLGAQLRKEEAAVVHLHQKTISTNNFLISAFQSFDSVRKESSIWNSSVVVLKNCGSLSKQRQLQSDQDHGDSLTGAVLDLVASLNLPGEKLQTEPSFGKKIKSGIFVRSFKNDICQPRGKVLGPKSLRVTPNPPRGHN